MSCLYTASKLWIFTQDGGDGIKSRLSRQILFTLKGSSGIFRILESYSPKLRGWKVVSLIAISGLLVQSTLTPSSANSLNFAESSLMQGTPGYHAIQITPFSRAFEASSDFIVSAQRLTESPGRSLSKKVSGVGFRNVIPLSSFRMPVSNRVPFS